jgi:2',3'-cyclic-nucleotide 2'-phosphodiesterase (5'-nucleotidase family)
LTPTIAFFNSGSIRNNSIIPIGDIDSSLPSTITPFNNEILVIEDVTVSDLHLALENSVSEVLEIFPRGYLAQISGFIMSWDTSQAVGNRIVDVFLDDGTPLIDDGVVVSSLLINIATNLFLAAGGDGYSMVPGSYTTAGTGIVDNVALSNLIQDGLSGLVSAAEYQYGVESRIFRNQQIGSVPNPATLALFGLGLCILCCSRRYKA